MLSRLKILLFVPLFLLSKSGFSQDNDYLRHRKFFDLCSYKKECSDCFDCGKEKYRVKIKNKADRKIRSVSYVFYSQVFNKILTKEATIQGGVIDYNQTGILYICIPDARHWAISEIVYDDGSSNKFVVKDRLQVFLQEPDECDCND